MKKKTLLHSQDSIMKKQTRIFLTIAGITAIVLIGIYIIIGVTRCSKNNTSTVATVQPTTATTEVETEPQTTVQPTTRKRITNITNSSTSHSSSGSSKSKYSYSSNSYDSGYNDVWLNDDYDTSRYRSDRHYAEGVDDAMEDEEW